MENITTSSSKKSDFWLLEEHKVKTLEYKQMEIADNTGEDIIEYIRLCRKILGFSNFWPSD